MGTRNLCGFRTMDGELKASYCQYDGYPSWKGKVMLEYIKENTDEDIERMAEAVQLVEQTDHPTKEELEKCVKYGYMTLPENETIDQSGSRVEWYWALHNIQDGLQTLNIEYPIMTDDKDFLEDSLFCEYAYFVNVRDKVLEFYVGWQRKPKDEIVDPDDEWNPCKMLITYPFDEIRVRETEDIVNEMNLLSEADRNSQPSY